MEGEKNVLCYRGSLVHIFRLNKEDAVEVLETIGHVEGKERTWRLNEEKEGLG